MTIIIIIIIYYTFYASRFKQINNVNMYITVNLVFFGGVRFFWLKSRNPDKVLVSLSDMGLPRLNMALSFPMIFYKPATGLGRSAEGEEERGMAMWQKRRTIGGLEDLQEWVGGQSSPNVRQRVRRPEKEHAVCEISNGTPPMH